jgi:hypothetical protein
MSSHVDIFVELGHRLTYFGSDKHTQDIIARAIAENGWFTRQDILRAVEAIRVDMLDPTKLDTWAASYPTPTRSLDVAVIMAGNIPLVGFFDMLCVLISGHRLHIKPSSKDRVLMRYIIDELMRIEPSIPIYDYDTNAKYDMAIATGGDAANNYFREHFATTRTLLRGSRHSIAILDGRESNEELAGLLEDICAYSGLGCRSCSMLFVPRGWQCSLHSTEAINSKLNNNIRALRAMLTMQQRPYIDCGGFIATYGSSFPTTLAAVTLYEYDSLDEPMAWIAQNRDSIQCIVSHCDIEGCVPLGCAQHPTLTDYADGIDTMLFLREA